jgi:hypothetical protein
MANHLQLRLTQCHVMKSNESSPTPERSKLEQFAHFYMPGWVIISQLAASRVVSWCLAWWHQTVEDYNLKEFVLPDFSQ